MSEEAEKATAAPKKKTGGYFAIDKQAWAKVCARGLNEAVAYLVLARGTLADNVTTSWSVNAVTTYTPIPRARATKAINGLCAANLVEKIKGGTKPTYCLRPVAQQARELKLAALSKEERAIFQKVEESGEIDCSAKEFQHFLLCRLVSQGLLSKIEENRFAVSKTAVDRIWLPNEIVDGTPRKETPPIERLWQTGDVLTLRLLVELYTAQNLPDDNGIDRSVLWQAYEREKISDYGEFSIFVFSGKSGTWVNSAADVVKPHLVDSKEENERVAGFWERLNTLEDLKLLNWVPYLFHCKDGEPIHPCIRSGKGTIEDKIGVAAFRAGLAMLKAVGKRGHSDSDLYSYTSEESRGVFIVPVPRHMKNVQMFGVARLHYRPKTKATSAWLGALHGCGQEWIKKYNGWEQRALSDQAELEERLA